MAHSISSTSNFITENRVALRDALQIFAIDETENDILNQQLDTSLSLAEHYIEKESPETAGKYFASWLRMVASQHGTKLQAALSSDKRQTAFIEKVQNILPAGSQSATTFVATVKETLYCNLASRIKILFIGDCLIWDIALQLQIKALAHGIQVEPVVLAQRIPSHLIESIEDTDKDIQLIFYSPFSFGFSSGYTFACKAGNWFFKHKQCTEHLDQSVKHAEMVINSLIDRFECPLFIHDVSGTVQHSNSLKGYANFLISKSSRTAIANYLNKQLEKLVNSLRLNAPMPVNILKETDALKEASINDLGKSVFNAGELHPTLLADILAQKQYLKILQSYLHFKEKKLIVCDLDNTLWDGVIGEGKVHPFNDRQRILQSLMKRGIVLAISSKNDPEKVHWQDCLLSGDDFVASEINWNLKLTNIRNIAHKLNLKLSSFIFLDDRADERFMVTEGEPGVLALDPDEGATWEMFNHWLTLLSQSELSDRTLVYKQRAERENYIREEGQKVDSNSILKSLGLKLQIRHAGAKDIARATELINRTNQFNTTVSRTTKQEITTFQKEGTLIVAELQDQFGDMGIISVLTYTKDSEITIIHFVLSCRAFGFSIEQAILNSLKRSGKSISAQLIKTSTNTPCHKVYDTAGFTETLENNWQYVSQSSVANPEWLQVKDSTKI